MKEFWSFIDEVRSCTETGVDSAKCLNQRFVDRNRSLQLVLGTQYFSLLASAKTTNLHAACSLIAGYLVGDDGFEQFRNWLLLQGREVFEGALQNPDSLAKLFPAGSASGHEPFDEQLGALLAGSIEAAATRDSASPRSEFRGEDLDYLQKSLPRLWTLFGSSYKCEPEPSTVSTAERYVEGLGTVRIGDQVEHTAGFGIATVLGFSDANTPIAFLDFSGSQRTMLLSKAFFRLPNAR